MQTRGPRHARKQALGVVEEQARYPRFAHRKAGVQVEEAVVLQAEEEADQQADVQEEEQAHALQVRCLAELVA